MSEKKMSTVVNEWFTWIVRGIIGILCWQISQKIEVVDQLQKKMVALEIHSDAHAASINTLYVSIANNDTKDQQEHQLLNQRCDAILEKISNYNLYFKQQLKDQ